MKNSSKNFYRKKELRDEVIKIKKSFYASNSLGGSKWNHLGSGKMEGGCIIFGGWLKVIPSSGAKYAYCTFGGIGVAGWNHSCTIISTFERIEDLYSNVETCMICSGSSLPDDTYIGAATDCILFDKSSNIVAVASTDAGIAALVGGSVTWKNK